MGNSLSSHFVTEIAKKRLLAQITQNKQPRCTEACGRVEDDVFTGSKSERRREEERVSLKVADVDAGAGLSVSAADLLGSSPSSPAEEGPENRKTSGSCTVENASSMSRVRGQTAPAGWKPSKAAVNQPTSG